MTTTDAASPPVRKAGSADLVRATLSQAGRKLILTVRTGSPVPLAELDHLPKPRSADSRYLCLALRAGGRREERRFCVGGTQGAHSRVGMVSVNAMGRATRRSTLGAQVKRPVRRKLVVVLRPDHARLAPRRYGWRVLERRDGCQGCEESLPAQGLNRFRLRPVRAMGCTGGASGLVRNGPRGRKLVSLTFDDGPSAHTEDFLDVLHNRGVDATFFQIGQEMHGRAEVMRRILREGNEIANHTTHHGFYPSYSDLVATNALIRAATHFQPCLFRPPGGAVNAAVIGAAGQAGMRTVLWDVDPTDWANPGSGAIHSRVVSAVRPGSIVVMHEGGGNRSGTLAALPSIIKALRARGYRFATVSELLGERMFYRPYG